MEVPINIYTFLYNQKNSHASQSALIIFLSSKYSPIEKRILRIEFLCVIKNTVKKMDDTIFCMRVYSDYFLLSLAQ